MFFKSYLSALETLACSCIAFCIMILFLNIIYFRDLMNITILQNSRNRVKNTILKNTSLRNAVNIKYLVKKHYNKYYSISGM